MYYFCVKEFKSFIIMLNKEILNLNVQVLFRLITLDTLLKYGNAYQGKEDQIKTKKMASFVVTSYSSN